MAVILDNAKVRLTLVGMNEFGQTIYKHEWKDENGNFEPNNMLRTYKSTRQPAINTLKHSR